MLFRSVAEDAQAYAAVSSAYKLPSDSPDAAARRGEAIATALLGAAQTPLETARACADVAELARTVAMHGNTNAISDAGVAALLAEAACRGAAYNVRINVASLEDKSRGANLVEEVKALVSRTASLAKDVATRVEASF